ncbi:hypothetical protein VN97_g11738 [Penicillium thymicola]|uniref:Carboxylesterase type B domain-containing protein n=1 Tax=Penicillium thymicola TaxID=293382 RepID=A0AAI9T6J4_PENTH|nr:hypothetical protein VN97_g11738 [Penicillium thymicola]
MKPPPALIPILQDIAAFSFLATAALVNHIDPRYDSPVWNVGQSVRTTSGLVVGHSATNACEVSEYVGIPHAAAPLGRLHFQPPVPYTGNDPTNAATFEIWPFDPATPVNQSDTSANTPSLRKEVELYSLRRETEPFSVTPEWPWNGFMTT